MRKILLFTLCNVLFVSLIAQWSSGGEPFSLNGELNVNVETFKLAALDVQALIAEDQENVKNGHIARSAVILPTNLNLYNSGVWTELENGDRVWRLVIHAEEALATTLLYENFKLPKGAKLFVYNPDYSQIIGAFTSYNNHESGQFTTEIIQGSRTVIEYYEPASQAFKGGFTISGVADFYKDVIVETDVLGFDDSENCEVNINCSEGNAWQDIKKGVARI
ncbi:MAG: hypothetical protein ACI860_000351, partial [Chitinophagales bacterium]